MYTRDHLPPDPLLIRPPAGFDDPDIGRANLACAVGLPMAGDVGVDRYLRILDEWTARVRLRTREWRTVFAEHGDEYGGSEPLWRMHCLCRTLTSDFGVRYNPDRLDPQADGVRMAEPDWTDSRDLFVHGLLGPKRSGTCSSIPVLIVAIGRRLGYPLNLVHAPGHVFCRWDGIGHRMRSWRRRHNIEMAGDREDDYYRRHPTWTPLVAARERVAETPMFLRSLASSEVAAAFLASRGHVFEECDRPEAAAAMYAAAKRLAPANRAYPEWEMTAVRKWHRRIEAQNAVTTASMPAARPQAAPAVAIPAYRPATPTGLASITMRVGKHRPLEFGNVSKSSAKGRRDV